MPALDDNVIRDVTERLKNYLNVTGGYNSVDFIDAGGSAAVFKVNRNGDIRAIKIFDPKFFVGNDNLAEKRRLLTQQKLIDHHCEHLIQTYYAAEAEGTAIIEMEFLSWPQLAKVLVNTALATNHLFLTNISSLNIGSLFIKSCRTAPT